ncbi:peptide chain release factor 2 [Neolewinella agarilytica]|uniref:Peptide chain release factor 2 n=1 Tax=Neolewinella agarilytica TaxID=478744 RepID=A0A1H9K3N0_9BACT|nr:peptide chain release factor 2 [Neolewinella agarilytica]SEQ93567.1 bacterial peptide chain release factor 2 (bRF-2) [Neolewinella agarilytica]
MTSDQLKELKDRLALLRGYLDVEKRSFVIEDLTQKSLDPEFWNDSKAAEAVMKQLQSNKGWVKQYQVVADRVDDLEILLEFLKEGEGTEEDLDRRYEETVAVLDDAEFRATLNRPEDELGCILEINAGAGGTEANDWAEMLLRMFTMYAEKHAGYKVRPANRNDGDVAGIKSATIEIEGDFAYGMMKGENGVHRLVRISPFNAQGKRQTSFASVFVHPLVDDSIEVEINPADLSWDTFRASGAGGQHVNKTESAVRVTHAPTGIVVECQDERSQHKNRDRAMKMLRSRIYEKELEKQRAEKEEVEAGKTANEWGSQIRSYVLDDRRVKDHRTGWQTSQTDAVLDGDLEGFLKAYLRWSGEAK